MIPAFEGNYPSPPVRASRKLRILVAPLDWGLGHAARCIPIIRHLIANQCEVVLAADGPTLSMLQSEFPELETTKLPGYRVSYSRHRWKMPWKILGQSSKILRTIRAEHEWLKTAIEALQLDAVISDNRYGLYTPAIPSVFITHQLFIKTQLGAWSQRLLQRKNYRFINRFSACWVPDVPSKPSLAGDLSHPSLMPAVPVHYLGVLSRFSGMSQQQPQKNRLLFMLSGPEPQRTILEEKILEDIERFSGQVVLVRGLPGNAGIIPSTNSIAIYNHLDTATLQQEINLAEFVICRSGYSSVMDLAVAARKSVLIPTPGQSEQEYLARHLSRSKFAPYVEQSNFTLENIFNAGRNFEYAFMEKDDKLLATTIDAFIESLR